MVTRFGVEGLEGVDRFEAVSREIEERFSHFHSLLEAQKAVLLDRVERMRELCQKHRDLDRAIGELEIVRKATTEMLNANMNVENKEEVTKLWDSKISDLKKTKFQLDYVSDLKFVENMEEFSHCVKQIHVRETEAVGYSNRREPLIMKGKRGQDNKGSFIFPMGISIDKMTNQTFVADLVQKLVYIYSAEGEFIKSFGEKQLAGLWGICVSGDFVYVSGGRAGVLKFRKTGEFMKQNISVCGGAQVKSLRGLCAHNECIYVCDKGNNRIAVLNEDLEFVKSFGNNTLRSPQDIKFENDKLFVLTHYDNIIYIFNIHYTLLTPMTLTGQINEMLYSPSFTIDLEGNFIICDTSGNCLKVFNRSGEYVESLGVGFLLCPSGIAMDNHQRIVALSQSDYNNIQIY